MRLPKFVDRRRLLALGIVLVLILVAGSSVVIADEPTDRVRDILEDNSSGGTVGLYLKESGGPVHAALNEAFVFEPASTIKVLIHVHAMKQVELGTIIDNELVTLDRQIQWFMDPDPSISSCPADTSPATDTLEVGLTAMKVPSDNRWTQALRVFFGNNPIDATRVALNMNDSRIQDQHRIGCGASAVANHNKLTLVDAGKLYEAVAAGFLVGAVRDKFYEIKIQDSARLNTVINGEAQGLGLSPKTVADFKARLKSALKAGSYTLADGEYLSVAGWVQLPFKKTCENAPRQYVFGAFIDAADTIDEDFNIRTTGIELLREQIRAALETWVPCGADLQLQKFCKPDEVAGPGRPFTCTILVENLGPALARDVVVNDTLITDVDDFVIGTPTVSFKDGGGPAFCLLTPPNQFSCDLGTLPVGSRATITTIITSNEGGQFNNVAQVQAQTPDPDTTNNKAVVSGITVRTCKLGVLTTEKVPPVVQPVGVDPSPGLEGKPVSFTVAATDNCNAPEELHKKWTFSDGGIGFGSATQHTFADNGVYTGTVHVSDKAGNEAQRDFSVVINNQPPVISPLPVPPKTPWGVPIEFSGQATDPGEADKANLRYHWDFGDGTSALNQKVSHAFPEPGVYTVTLTVSDDKDQTTATVPVTINKRPTTIKNCGETQVEQSAHKVPLCARLLVADIDGGDLDAGVKGKTLSFTLAQNKIVSGDTDANGESRPSVNLVLSAGCIPGVISFAGDDLYEPFTYEYVFYTVGGGHPGSPAGQVCELNEASAGFQLLDSDGDGCSNGQEAGSAALLGGMRDQDNAYDFFDVPVGTPDDSRKDKIVSVSDIGAVVARFGATGDASGALFLGPIPQGRTYHPAFDRTSLGPELWNLGPPDGRITVQDIGLVVAQFGHSCA